MLSEDWEETDFVENSIEVVRRLYESDQFGGRVYLVSKCGPKVEDRTRQWLRLRGFYDQTGLLEHQVYYVRDYAAKGLRCADLGISHFIDDRVANLTAMTTVTWRYLFAPLRPNQIPPWATWVGSWLEFERQVRSQTSF